MVCACISLDCQQGGGVICSPVQVEAPFTAMPQVKVCPLDGAANGRVLAAHPAEEAAPLQQQAQLVPIRGWPPSAWAMMRPAPPEAVLWQDNRQQAQDIIHIWQVSPGQYTFPGCTQHRPVRWLRL